MRTHKIIYFFYIFFIFILCTCNDPVFYAISDEVKQTEPRIKGVPTNFVVYDGRMYVASGDTLYSYRYDESAVKDSWKNETSPGGNILQIAATTSYLYALCATDKNNNEKTVVKCWNRIDSKWETIEGLNYAKIQDIFAVDGTLFIWAVTSTSNYNNNIFYIKSGEDVKNLMNNQNDTGRITGAACNGPYCFLSFLKTDKNNGAIKSSGVYKIDVSNYNTQTIALENVHFNGIINLENSAKTILLISRSGEVYTVDTSIVKITSASMNKMSTGALAIWRDKDDPGKKLLLAGRQDSLYYSSSSYNYSYGYMELELDDTGVKSGAKFTEPGRNTSYSTLSDYDRYQSSLGKYPLNYIFQAPFGDGNDIDKERTLFASTQKSGVWSLRVRDEGKKYWNAEGEDEPKY